MKVILRTDITNVGRQGEIKEVAAGFARNFLLPKKLVMEATPQNLKIWEREAEHDESCFLFKSLSLYPSHGIRLFTKRT